MYRNVGQNSPVGMGSPSRNVADAVLTLTRAGWSEERTAEALMVSPRTVRRHRGRVRRRAGEVASEAAGLRSELESDLADLE